MKHSLAWACVYVCVCVAVRALRSSCDIYTSALVIGGQIGRPLKPTLAAKECFTLKLWQLDQADKYPEAQNVLTIVNYCGQC